MPPGPWGTVPTAGCAGGLEEAIRVQLTLAPSSLLACGKKARDSVRQPPQQGSLAWESCSGPAPLTLFPAAPVKPSLHPA